MKRIEHQFFRYVIVGFLNNAAGYLLFLLLTSLFNAPKLIMTVLYIFGTAVGFFANKNFTFKYRGELNRSILRYCLVQILGYTLNLSVLVFFVDWLGFAYQYVQAFAIVVVAIFLFLCSRLYIFAKD